MTKQREPFFGSNARMFVIQFLVLIAASIIIPYLMLPVIGPPIDYVVDSIFAAFR